MKKNILITGSTGFIGKNLLQTLKYQYKDLKVSTVCHLSSEKLLKTKLLKADYLIHLAGVNRPKKKILFKNNFQFTSKLCNLIASSKKKISIIYTSTAHIDKNNNKSDILKRYADSKLKAEEILKKISKEKKFSLYIFRVPHVIGKYAKPNYNSVLATFCHNIARNKKIKISKSDPSLEIIHIDNLIDRFLKIIISNKNPSKISILRPKQFKAKVSYIAKKLKQIDKSIIDNHIFRPINLFEKVLYSTYITYLPKNKIIRKIKTNFDKRGNFSEVLKSKDFGQLSYFTSLNNISRGNHYHNLKCEIFLVVSGRAEYLSKNIFTKSEIKTFLSADNPHIIRTIPGDIHSIKKIGKKELIVLVWSNEIFNKNLPDTYS